MSNKEQCPECGSFQICTERRPNGKKWCTSCNHVLETGFPILKNHDPSKSISSFKGKEFLFEAKESEITQEGIGLSRKELRTKELEKCRDEVRAVLEKHNAFLSANPSERVEFCCNKGNYPEYEIYFEEL